MRLLIAFACLLTACAAHPRFQKNDGELGYTAKPTPIPEILLIETQLPASTAVESRLDYLARAAGEECAARKFSHFDLGLTPGGGARAFCYADANARVLNVVFDAKLATATAPQLRVVETANGVPAPFRPFDVVRKVDGRPVRNLAELKETVFLAAKKGAQRVSVSVERSDIPLLLEAPLAEGGETLLGPEKLEELRAKAR